LSSIACAEAKEAAKAEARAVPNPKSYSDSPRAQAKEVAGEAAKAEARAAASALRAVEAGIAVYAERRDYLKLKDIAEASDVAGKVAPRPAPPRPAPAAPAHMRAARAAVLRRAATGPRSSECVQGLSERRPGLAPGHADRNVLRGGASQCAAVTCTAVAVARARGTVHSAPASPIVLPPKHC